MNAVYAPRWAEKMARGAPRGRSVFVLPRAHPRYAQPRGAPINQESFNSEIENPQTPGSGGGFTASTRQVKAQRLQRQLAPTQLTTYQAQTLFVKQMLHRQSLL